jgi:hypothetical protein
MIEEGRITRRLCIRNLQLIRFPSTDTVAVAANSNQYSINLAYTTEQVASDSMIGQTPMEDTCKHASSNIIRLAVQKHSAVSATMFQCPLRAKNL